jgi:hypothetical protein
VTGLFVQCIEGRADDPVTHAGQPAGAALALLVHVQAQHLDEQHLGQLGQYAFAAGAGRTGLGQCVTNRRLEPFAGIRVAYVDPHNGRQAVQQHARQPRVARQVAAHQAADLAATAVAQLARTACEDFVQSCTGGGFQTRPRTHAMGVALGKQHHVPGTQAHRRIIAEFDVALAFGDQVKDHHPFGIGLQERGGGVGARRLVAPGRGEPGVDEDRTDQADDAQGLGQGVHRASPVWRNGP